jgi:hypothetical protein
VAPRQVIGRWLGRENVEHPLVARMAMMLGGRDLALGVASLQTLDDPIAGPRVLCRVCAGRHGRHGRDDPRPAGNAAGGSARGGSRWERHGGRVPSLLARLAR